MITSKPVQMEIKLWRSVIEGTKYFFQNNGYWACGIYTAGQVWLRWQSDQPLDSPYSASLLMNQTSQDENYNNNQLEDIVLMYQQILRTLMWRETKDSEGELKMVKIWSLFKYIYSFTRLKKT